MGSLGRITGVVVALAALLLLVGLVPAPIFPAQANTGCPAASNGFGSQTWTSSCTVDSDTTWGNGTLTISGSVTVNAGATLTLWNLVVQFASTADLQRSLTVYGTLIMEYGALQSADSYHWSLTSSGSAARVVLEHASVTGAGSGSTFGIVVTGGGGNRFAYDTMSGVNLKALGTNGDYVGYSNISNYDDSVLNQHVVWMGPNSTFEHNTLWDITLGTQSAVTNYETYGNVLFFANTLYLRAAGSNAMGFEVINEQSSQVSPLYPGPWVAQLLWNNVTFTYVGSGTNSNGFDNEFSERVHIAHNTVTNLGSNPVTECIEGGGLTDALVEFNRCVGGSGGFDYGIYDYIYENTNNVFRNNTFDAVGLGAIVQAGGITFADNTFTHVGSVGLFLCPNASCAGSSANTSNNAWYNNTVSFASSGDLTRMSPSNAFYNIVMAHGGTQWTDGATQYPVNGDWLYFSNAPIQTLRVADGPGGYRTLSMTTGGHTYSDTEPAPAVADEASLALSGSLDALGSVQGGTVFWSLDPTGTTSVDVTATGAAMAVLRDFAPSYLYNVSVANVATHAVQNLGVTTDASGSANFSWDAGTTATQYSIVITGNFPAQPDTTPPAQVTDLRPMRVGSSYTILSWTAPGDNGTVGQASAYDLRYSMAGPLDNATFDQGTVVPTPAPGLPGTLESLNVTGLQPSTTYWFALRTADAVPNWSPISDVATATTLAASAGNGSVPVPRVLDVVTNASTSTVDVVFSAPMDQASVLAALNVTPATSYRVEWVNDSHLQIVFDGSLPPSTDYLLTIGASAADRHGVALGAAYYYRFTSPASMPPPSTPPPPSDALGILALLAVVAGAAILVAYLAWSGRIPAATRALRGLAHRLRRRGKGEGREPPAEPPAT